MDRLDLQTPDFTEEHIHKLAELFPNCVTETADEKGHIKKAIDFDLLKQELSAYLVEGPKERYRLDWPGKRASLLKANTPITKTLRPAREESVNFDTTQNLYIEGDNLEALKLLQEAYLGKVKMIYIDPPYNTGKDFVYKDNFARSREEELMESGQVDEEGNRLVQNLESNGRFHSDWLSMMYPRLRLARNLLRDDGVIFISIDDNEVHNLRKMCDEVFGEGNYIAEFIWEKTFRPSNFGKTTRKNTEYVISYSKSNPIELKGSLEDSKGDFSLTKKLHNTHTLKCPSNYVHVNFQDGIYKKGKYGDGYELLDDIYVKNGKVKNEFRIKIKQSIWSQKHLNNEIDRGVYLVLKNEKTMALYARKVYKKNELKPTTLLPNDIVGDVLEANKEINNLFKTNLFDYPKPSSLPKYLMTTCTEDEDIILDFFSGSATTAHAVMQLNAEDGGNRRFIMVQLPEPTDPKSEAYKAGYTTIADIGKERIRRAGKKIKEENKEKEGIEKLDIGFRVLKVDSSNMKEIYFTPDEVSKESLFETVDHIKEDRTPEDLLFGVLVDWGVDLSLPIRTEEIEGKTVYFVGHGDLVACFEEDIDENFVKTLAKKLADEDVLRVVFKESGFEDDNIKINTEQIFKQLAPAVEVRVV